MPHSALPEDDLWSGSESVVACKHEFIVGVVHGERVRYRLYSSVSSAFSTAVRISAMQQSESEEGKPTRRVSRCGREMFAYRCSDLVSVELFVVSRDGRRYTGKDMH